METVQRLFHRKLLRAHPKDTNSHHESYTVSTLTLKPTNFHLEFACTLYLCCFPSEKTNHLFARRRTSDTK